MIQGPQGWQCHWLNFSISLSLSHHLSIQSVCPLVGARRHLHEQGARCECYTLEYEARGQPITSSPIFLSCQLSVHQCNVSVDLGFSAQQNFLTIQTDLGYLLHAQPIELHYPSLRSSLDNILDATTPGSAISEAAEFNRVPATIRSRASRAYCNLFGSILISYEKVMAH